MKHSKIFHAALALGLLVAPTSVIPVFAEEAKPAAAEAAKSEAAPTVQWVKSYDEAKEQAAKAKKPMLLDFYADG